MDVGRFTTFAKVAEMLSFSRAAKALRLRVSSVSRTVARLEAELGAQLFDRSHAGVTPTPAGLQLYEDARRLLSDADAVRERIQRLPQGPEGSVTVALPFLLASLLMGPVLAQLKATHPRIRVFVLDDLSLMVKKAMLDRRADVGILVDTLQVEGLQCKPLAREPMYFCGQDADSTVAKLLHWPAKKTRGARKSAAPATTTQPRPEIDFADAVAQPLVLQSRRYAIRRTVEDTAAALGLPINIVHEHDSARVIRSLYLNGAGFTLTPACAMQDAPPHRPDWIVARITRPALPRTYTLATHAGKPADAATQVVIDALAGQAQAMIERGDWEAEWLQR